MTPSPFNRLETHWPTPNDDAPPVDPREVMNTADAWRKRVERFIGDHPQVAILAAAAGGILLGWYVKRK